MKQPLRVAVIEPVGGHGGMDYYDFGLCGGLATEEIDVVLHTCDETKIPVGESFEVRHTFGNLYGQNAVWRSGLCYVWGTFRALFSSIWERRSIVHFHYFHVGFLQAFQVGLARLLGLRVVITAHDVEAFVESLEVPALSRWVYRMAHRVIAHNWTSKQELIERIGLSPDKVAIIPHGNYLHALRTLPSRREACKVLDLPEQARILLFFGQIKDVKGLDLLLEAMPRILQKYPDTLLLIAGKPWKSDFSRYEKLVRDLGIAQHCRMYIRYIQDDEVPLYFGVCDLVVLPYRRIYQSGAVLMAMSYAKTVLVSDLPGMTEIIKDGENGFVFHTGDASDLSRKVNSIFADSERNQKAARKGFEHVRDRYDWRQVSITTNELYKKVLSH